MITYNHIFEKRWNVMTIDEDNHLKRILSEKDCLPFKSKFALESDLIRVLGDTSLDVTNYEELMTRLDWEDVLDGVTFKLLLSCNCCSYIYYFEVVSKLDESHLKVIFKGLHKIL